MFKFTTSATLLNNILSATSSKGHIFVLPTKEGMTFSNSLEEDDISVYNMIDSDNLEKYEYDRNEDDVYCFMVQDLSPLISRITGLVTLSFDEMKDGEISFIHILAENGKFAGKTALKDEEHMEDTLGLNETKRDARHHHVITFLDQDLLVPKPMFDIGESKIFHFKNPIKPLIIESEDVVITIDNKKKEFRERIKTTTSEYAFSEKFDNSEKLSDEQPTQVFEGEINLNVTSSFLEGSIKKHQSPISDMLLIKIPSEMIPYNVVFISEKNVSGYSFFTASILSLRVEG